MDTVRHQIPLSNNVTITATVTNQFSTICNWISEVRSAHNSTYGATVIGLARRVNANSLVPKTATLQLCCDDKCLLVQLHHLGITVKDINTLLQRSDFIFAAADDVEFSVLYIEYDMQFSRKVNIKSLHAPPAKLGDASCGKTPEQLAERLLGVKVDKPQSVEESDWEATILTFDQAKDACLDAYLAYRVGNFLINGC